MKETKTDGEGIFNFPDEEEIKAAQLACCGRYCTACEAPAEYAWRKRSVDLSVLLENAIEKELTETEREIIKEFWFFDKTQSEIARARGITPAAVHLNLERAQGKLRNVLGYTVMYQNEVMADSTVIPLALARARVIAAARNAHWGTAGDRIRRLRQSENLSRVSLCGALGMTEGRLKGIENSAVLPDARETVAVSEFFGVTTDYILKGA